VNPKFLCAIALSLVDHFTWFRFFHLYQGFAFTEILAFFTICIWLVPFGFFVSLSSTDSMLPGIHLGAGAGGVGVWRSSAGADFGSQELDASELVGGSKPRRSVNRLLWLFNFLRKKRQEILPSSVLNVKAL